jgi:murein DD-endopeptidase MepM/ murein hydrolase activator NlpD
MEKYKQLKVSFGFGETDDPLNGDNDDYFHRGIDLKPCKHKLVRSPFYGKVRKISHDKKGGLYVQIKSMINDIPFYTNLFHNKIIFVEEKDVVRQDEIVALSGSTGEVTGEHIHLEICSYALKSNFIIDCMKNVPCHIIKKEGRVFFEPFELYDYFKLIGVNYDNG